MQLEWERLQNVWIWSECAQVARKHTWMSREAIVPQVAQPGDTWTDAEDVRRQQGAKNTDSCTGPRQTGRLASSLVLVVRVSAQINETFCTEILSWRKTLQANQLWSSTRATNMFFISCAHKRRTFANNIYCTNHPITKDHFGTKTLICARDEKSYFLLKQLLFSNLHKRKQKDAKNVFPNIFNFCLSNQESFPRWDLPPAWRVRQRSWNSSDLCWKFLIRSLQFQREKHDVCHQKGFFAFRTKT